MTTTTFDPYPAPYETHYGHHVWPLGEDGDEGVLIAGHGRRALAALNAYARGQDPTWKILEAADPEERWVKFHETCGCTEEQHVGHADLDGGCDDVCSRIGLPPCDPDRFAWRRDDVQPGDEGALPVTEVRW